jgi:hypothetical protein
MWADDEVVAVGRRLRDVRHRDRARPAALVLDVHGLPELGRELLRDGARDDLGCAPRRERRTRRIGLFGYCAPAPNARASERQGGRDDLHASFLRSVRLLSAMRSILVLAAFLAAAPAHALSRAPIAKTRSTSSSRRAIRRRSPWRPTWRACSSRPLGAHSAKGATLLKGAKARAAAAAWRQGAMRSRPRSSTPMEPGQRERHRHPLPARPRCRIDARARSRDRDELQEIAFIVGHGETGRLARRRAAPTAASARRSTPWTRSTRRRCASA